MARSRPIEADAERAHRRNDVPFKSNMPSGEAVS